MYYESRIEKFFRLVTTAAKHFQGQNYWFIMIPCLLFSGLSLILNKGFPPQNEFDMFFYYKDFPERFLIDSIAGLLCLFMTIPTSYMWWNLRKEFYFYVHIPVFLVIFVLIISGSLFSLGLLALIIILLLLIGLAWLYGKIR